LIATIVTFITTRIVAVFITTIVVVAAVPSLIVLIHGNTITITTGPVASASRQHGDDERTRLILEVKTAGDDVLTKIHTEEASCDSQLDQLAAQSKISATETQADIDKGKSQIHSATTPFVNEIDADESEFSHLTVVSTTTEQTFLVRISEARVTALGENGTTGLVVTVCQTVLIEIRQIIITVVVQPGGGGDEGD
jgi:cell division protein FtsL